MTSRWRKFFDPWNNSNPSAAPLDQVIDVECCGNRMWMLFTSGEGKALVGLPEQWMAGEVLCMPVDHFPERWRLPDQRVKELPLEMQVREDVLLH